MGHADPSPLCKPLLAHARVPPAGLYQARLVRARPAGALLGCAVMTRGTASGSEPPRLLALLLATARGLLLALAIGCPLVVGSAVARPASIASVSLALC